MIKIKEIQGQKRVYYNRRLIGTVRKFCCGVDFRPIEKPKALFSILSVNPGSKELLECIEAIATLKIPDKSFHWNFRHELTTNATKLKKYQKDLSAL